jgi:hypothetical protein
VIKVGFVNVVANSEKRSRWEFGARILVGFSGGL